MKRDTPNTAGQSPVSIAGPGVHLPVLDGLRGLAILLVMLFHQTVMSHVNAVDNALFNIMGVGWCGVDLFFVLSGFLITGILLDTRDGPGYFRTFYARRTLRIFPLYYAVVIAVFVVVPVAAKLTDSSFLNERIQQFQASGGSPIWYWLYLQNYSMAWTHSFQHRMIGVVWSLAIEEQFYLVWPAVIYFCRRVSLKWVCFGLIAAAIALRIWIVARGSHPIVAYILTPTRMDSLAIGALVAIQARERAGLTAWTRAAPAASVGGLAGAVALVVIDGVMGWSTAFDTAPTSAEIRSMNGPLVQMFGFTLFAIGFAGLLVMCLTSERGSLLHRTFGSSTMRMLGKYSYALYLFHAPIRGAIRDKVFGPVVEGKPPPHIPFPKILGSETPAQVLFYVVATLATLALAWLSWQLFEKHFLKLKKYFEYREPKGDASSDPPGRMPVVVPIPAAAGAPQLMR
ncbi:MAG TPA: acyltransferase [Phycisphaerales bacterium]|nr:acyltransferase [Phycisphaerales bacterium]